MKSNNSWKYIFGQCVQVCSAVQLSGFLLCLHGAARITHRAQGIVSVATRWHMGVTCASSGSDQWKGHSPEADKYNDSDSESSDIFLTISPHEPSLFQTRQALGKYIMMAVPYKLKFGLSSSGNAFLTIYYLFVKESRLT